MLKQLLDYDKRVQGGEHPECVVTFGETIRMEEGKVCEPEKDDKVFGSWKDDKVFGSWKIKNSLWRLCRRLFFTRRISYVSI